MQAKAAGDNAGVEQATAAARMVGAEIGREWLMGMAWALEMTPDEVVDGWLRGRGEKVRQAVDVLKWTMQAVESERVKAEKVLVKLKAANA